MTITELAARVLSETTFTQGAIHMICISWENGIINTLKVTEFSKATAPAGEFNTVNLISENFRHQYVFYTVLIEPCSSVQDFANKVEMAISFCVKAYSDKMKNELHKYSSTIKHLEQLAINS